MSGQRGNRTPDTGIFSPLLYRLSYLADTDRFTRPRETGVAREGIEPPTRGFSVPCSTD
jgi:hypothetical protein